MPRASAAAFSGSGFGPASGGHTTAAIVSPAASRPRSTSSAKAACPTRRMRIGGSGLQMRREELLEPRPRVLGRGLLVRGAFVAEEAVLRAGVDDHLDCLPVTPGLGLELLDAVERDVRVLLAEEGEHGALELRRLLGREPAAVEGCARLDLVVQSERLLDDEHAGHAGAVLRPRQEGGHRADRRRHFDHLALHCGTPPGGVGAQPVAASVIGGALHRAMPWRGALSYR